jgi:DNA-binding beta-propeller fold protein YncE
MKITALAVPIALLISISAHAQKPSTAPSRQPLVLTGAIPLPNVHGRIDHFSFDPQGRLFVSALGNNTEEVIDLVAGTVGHIISGIPRPQGVAYAADTNEIFVGSDEGKLNIYNGTSYNLITSIDFGDDVDNLCYDPATKRLYVGYGDGVIAIVDGTTNKRFEQEFKVGAHPESFQLEKAGPNIYVNVPDRKEVAVVNRNTGAITRWPLRLEGNFPMALDEADHRLFIATRQPPRFVVLDANSGHVIATFPCGQDSDDMYYDPSRKRVYVVAGEGNISVFQQSDPDHYSLLAKVPSAVGARTAGYFGKGPKGFERFYVAVPARADRGAEVLVYTVQD